MKNATKKLLRLGCILPLTTMLILPIAEAHPTVEKDPSGMSHENMQMEMAGSEDIKESMSSGMLDMQNMQMTGNVDKDFAMMMKIHHQQAVEMAKMELANGKSSAMKAMAKKIISAQKKEIAQFDQWLAKQK